ncbi:PAS domain S-box protein [Vibrio sp. CAU 1672]|nr:PAS domain S-box protein [Vibrio sp. CAU 1672]
MTITSDTDGKIVELEGDVTKILGWEIKELIGKPVIEIIPFKHRERHNAGWERWNKKSTKKAMGSWLQVDARRVDGNTLPVELCITERSHVVTAIIETPADITLPRLDED